MSCVEQVLFKPQVSYLGYAKNREPSKGSTECQEGTFVKTVMLKVGFGTLCSYQKKEKKS